MKAKSIYLLLILFFFFFDENTAQVIKDDIGYIPVSNKLDWHEAGLENPSPLLAQYLLNVLDFGATPEIGSAEDTDAFKNAINAAGAKDGLTIIFIPEGSYLIKEQLNINTSNCLNGIVFRGEGADKTKLSFFINNVTKCFYIHGEDLGFQKDIDQDIFKDSKDISVTSIDDNYQIGNWVHYYELEHHVIDGRFDKAPSQIGKIEYKMGSIITLQNKASKNYLTSNDLRISRIKPIKNIGIENLKISRTNSGDSATGSNILFEYTVNSWIKGVESSYTCRHHVEIQYSSHIELSGNHFHHANDYDNDGRGSGVVLQMGASHVLVENNVFNHLRHSMVVQAGANCNVFAFNYSTERYWEEYGFSGLGTKGDISIHGAYPYGNLFENNICAQIIADDYNGNNGPFNAFLRNKSLNREDVMTDMYLIDIPEVSVLGCVLAPVDGGVLNIVSDGATLAVDLYGFFGGDPVPNSLVNLASPYAFYLEDISYYYSAKPDFLSSNYTWPAIGPEPEEGTFLDTGDIPARDRYNSTSTIKTYRANLTILPQQSVTLENALSNDGNVGSVKIDGQNYSLPLSNPPTFEVGDIVAIEASSTETFSRTLYSFTNWQDGSTERTRNIAIGPGGYFDRANFEGKPLSVSNIRIVSSIGQNIKIAWDQHPNSGVSYKIWRSSKNRLGGEVTITLCTTLPNSTTTWTDGLYTDSNSTGNYLLYYAIQPHNNLDNIDGDRNFYLFSYGSISFWSMDSLVFFETSFEENNEELKNDLEIYPNPFNPTSTVFFTIMKSGNVNIDLYNINGQLVEKLHNSYLNRGSHQVKINGSNLSSGVYFIKFRSTNFNTVKRIVLLK